MDRLYRRLPVAACAMALMLTTAPLHGQQNSQESHNSQEAPLEGTWLFTIDRIHQGFSFTALQSFTAGGVTLATGSRDRVPPPPISTLFGSWERVHANKFAATLYFYAFDPLGNAVAMIKTNLVLDLQGRDELRGSGEAYNCDLNAENCVRVPAVDIQITGKRLKPERIHD